MYVKNNASPCRPGAERGLWIALEACVSIGRSSVRIQRKVLYYSFLANCGFRVPVVFHSYQVQPTAVLCLSLAFIYKCTEDTMARSRRWWQDRKNTLNQFPRFQSPIVVMFSCVWFYILRRTCVFISSEAATNLEFECSSSHHITHKALVFQTI